MSFKDPEQAKSRLSTIQLFHFTVAVAAADLHLKRTIGKSSDRQVVAILSDLRLLRSLIAPAAAEGVIRMIKSLGNAGRYGKGALSDKTLRTYLRQLRTAWQDYCDDRANAFQLQFVNEVLPIAMKAPRTVTQESG
jgi:hypothetical protein